MKKFEKSHETIEAAREQCGALCYRMSADGTFEVLLITSRDTGRWVIPKGWPMPKRGLAGAARREAFEEAGVEGKIMSPPIGLYSYDKILGPEQSVPCVVTVHALRVERLLDKFPERSERKRQWFPPGEAADLVQEPELAGLIRSFSPDP